jgi:uncharacterized membrane protein
MHVSSETATPDPRTGVTLRALPLAAVAGIALVSMLLPEHVVATVNLVGYAVCHRIPARSFYVAGNQLPMCARDTGMFSAALLSLVALATLRRSRASEFPPRPYAFVFVGCFVAWAIDGVNSYVLLATGHELLYTPQNWLRLATGAAMGVALSAYVAALFNQATWSRPDVEPTIGRWREVAGLAGIALAVIAAVVWRPDFLYGPIAVVSTLGVITLLTIVNGLLVLVIIKRHGLIERWCQLVPPLAVGLLLTALQIAAIDVLRAALTQHLNLPF